MPVSNKMMLVGAMLVLLVAGQAEARTYGFEDESATGRDIDFDGMRFAPVAVDQSLMLIDTGDRTSGRPDLQGPAEDGGPDWAGGNLDRRTELRHVLPATPGGIELRLDQPTDAIGFDVINLDRHRLADASLTFYAGSKALGTLTLDTLIDPASELFDPTLHFTPRSVNRLPLLGAWVLGHAQFDRVVIHLPEEAAIDNVRAQPASPGGGGPSFNAIPIDSPGSGLLDHTTVTGPTAAAPTGSNLPLRSSPAGASPTALLPPAGPVPLPLMFDDDPLPPPLPPHGPEGDPTATLVPTTPTVVPEPASAILFTTFTLLVMGRTRSRRL